MTLRYLTAGESHGKALVGILEGMPAGLEISVRAIRAELTRRKHGYGRGARQKIETEEIEILSGVRHGKTIGSPIALLMPNADSKNWGDIMAVEGPGSSKRRVVIPRPGHADLAGALKYGFSDMRDVLERASARETAMRVAVASLARELLKACGILVASRVVVIGSVEDPSPIPCKVGVLNRRADASPVRATEESAARRMVAAIDRAKNQGDTVGGIFEVYADGLPRGLGSYVHWDRRLEAPIAAAFMSLNAVKGVEIGIGFKGARLPGSLVHDAYAPKGRKIATMSNNSGGLDGGMTTGEPLIVRAAMKPIATLMKPLGSVDLKTGQAARAHVERSDYCAVPAAAVIGESLLALVLASAVLDKFGGDSMRELLPRLRAWKP